MCPQDILVIFLKLALIVNAVSYFSFDVWNRFTFVPLETRSAFAGCAGVNVVCREFCVTKFRELCFTTVLQ
jgi:hypothetical protein